MSDAMMGFIRLMHEATHYGELADWFDLPEAQIMWHVWDLKRKGHPVPKLLPGRPAIDIRELLEIVIRIAESGKASRINRGVSVN